MTSRYIYYILIVFAWLVGACAQITAPTGGKKDILPPEVEETLPPNESLNFSSKKIELKFDEFVVLDNATENVVVSPPIDPAPEFILKGKRVIVKIDAELKANTTYNFNFGAAIKDLNEGNQIENYQYVFSTGDYLDSLKIGGLVVDAETGKVMENVYVCLYTDNSDSVAYYQKPYYFARTNATGNFNIGYLAPGSYKFLAFQDLNNNLLYDQNSEPVAFYPEPIVVEAGDSTASIPNYKFNLFIPKKEGVQLLANDTKQPGRIYLVYSNPLESLRISSVSDSNSLQGLIYDFNPTKDTITAWYSNNYVKSESIEIVANDSIIDTLTLRSYPINEDSLVFTRLNSTSLNAKRGGGAAAVQQSIDIGTNPLISWERPVNTIDSQRISLLKDSTELTNFTLEAKSTARREFELVANWEQGSQYTLIIPDSTFFDVFGLTHDTLNVQYTVKTPEDYGRILVTLEGLTGLDYPLLVQLRQQETTIETHVVNPIDSAYTFTYSNINPGRYRLYIIYDINGNGKWDTGDYYRKQQPERTYVYPDEISLKADWDFEVIIELGSQPEADSESP